MDKVDHYDMVIVGGGAVGLSLLLSLYRKNGLNILVLESRNTTNLDLQNNQLLSQVNQDRFIVLSGSSRKFYQNLGVWRAIEPHCTPISSIEVSIQGQYGTSTLKASECFAPALGYVISLYQLEAILEKTFNAIHPVYPGFDHAIAMGARLVNCEYRDHVWQITYEQHETIKYITTQCLMGADGQNSLVRTKNNIGLTSKAYGHRAIIGTVNTQGHLGQAFERFLKTGAIAFLPLQNQRAVFIWTVPDEQAIELFEKTDHAFLESLQKVFGYRLGQLSDVQAKKIFPLHMMQAHSQGNASQNLLLMGTAALSLHPIGAQGLNLSLRNIQVLAKLIESQLHDQNLSKPHLNIQSVIQVYLELIRRDQSQTIWVTDKLASYVAGGPFAMPLRAIGLLLFDSLSPIKRAFTQMNMGLRV